MSTNQLKVKKNATIQPYINIIAVLLWMAFTCFQLAPEMGYEKVFAIVGLIIIFITILIVRAFYE